MFSSLMAATAAELKGAVFLGLGWNELGIFIGAMVGVAGVVFSQYWAWRKHELDKTLINAQIAALTRE